MSVYASIPETVFPVQQTYRQKYFFFQQTDRASVKLHDSQQGRRKMLNLEILMQRNLFRPQDQCGVEGVSKDS